MSLSAKKIKYFVILSHSPFLQTIHRLTVQKNTVCTCCQLFYSNFITEAQCLPYLFPFLNCCWKNSIIYIFQSLNMREQSNERHILVLSGLCWHVIIPPYLEKIILFFFFRSRFHAVAWRRVRSFFIEWTSVSHVENWTTKRKHLLLSWTPTFLQLCNIVQRFPTFPLTRTPSCTPRSGLY